VLCLVAGMAQAQDEVSPPPPPVQLLVSVADQKLIVMRDGGVIAKYPISTSRYGAGDSYGSYKTPLGKLRVCDKIGDDLSPGAVIKHRSATGEVIQVNAPGRDPIVTRVIWLDGMEDENHNAKARGIYIHGTPEEKNLGKPVSWGCIRMRSEDVIQVYNLVGPGTEVDIIPDKLPRLHKYRPPPPPPPPKPAEIIVTSTPPPSQAGKAPAPVARQTPPPELVAKADSTPAPATRQHVTFAGTQSQPPAQQQPIPKTQSPPAVAEKTLPQKNSGTERIAREIAALNIEAEKPSKPSSNPEAWRSMKGSILSSGLSGAPLAPVAPKTTPAPAAMADGVGTAPLAGDAGSGGATKASP